MISGCFVKYIKSDPDKVFIVPNGVDIKSFSNSTMPSQLKNKIGLNPNKKVILFHGLLSAKQNYEAANLIIDSIAPRILDAIFVIIGKDPCLIGSKLKLKRAKTF